MSDATLVRIDLSCRRFGVAIARVLNIHIRGIEASLQDRALKTLESCFVQQVRVRSIPRRGPDGSKLSLIASAVEAHQEVEPDESPV